MSATTPTTVNHGHPTAGGPTAKRRPTASRPGHSRVAIAALTIATRAGPRPSAVVKARPRSSGVANASKTSPAISSRRNGNGGVPAPSPPSAATILLADRADEQLAADPGALDARQRRDALEHGVVEGGALRRRQIGRRRDVHRDDALGLEPGIDAAHVPPAAQPAGRRRRAARWRRRTGRRRTAAAVAPPRPPRTASRHRRR